MIEAKLLAEQEGAAVVEEKEAAKEVTVADETKDAEKHDANMESEGEQEAIMAAMDDILVASGPDFEIKKPEADKKMQQSTLASAFTKQVNSKIAKLNLKVGQVTTTDNEESEGLEFIDPAAEKRALLVEAAKEREEKNQTIMINGQTMTAHAIPG